MREYQLQNYNRPIDVFLPGSAFADGMNLVPEYQRGSVWTLDQRRALILSLTQGLPIGAIFVNNRSVFDSAIIDGKQRIETIRAFAADEFDVPGEWFGQAGPVTFGQLPDRERRGFTHRSVATYETHFAAPNHLDAEVELFLRINWGGTPQDDAHRARVAALKQALAR